MSFLLQESIEDPSNNAPVLNITPHAPIGLRDIMDIIGNVRLRHGGVISFARGSMKKGEIDRMGVVSTGKSRNPSSAGWHMHGGFFSVNISRGSGIPTLFAKLEDVSQAVVAAVRSNMDGVRSLNSVVGSIPIDVLDLDEQAVKGKSRKLLEHMEVVMDTLSNSQSTLEQVAQALNSLRTLVIDVGDNPSPGARFYGNVFFNIARESQIRIPPEKVLAMSPKKHDVYVVPPQRIHARSVREGRLFRTDHEQNVFVGLHRDPGRQFHTHPWAFDR